MTALLATLHLLGAALLSLYALSELFLLIGYLRRRPQIDPPSPAHWPTVTVQLPLYNEGAVVERLLQAAAALDYPAESLTIQVLDDSTDTSAAHAARCVDQHRAAGIPMQYLRRDGREGYKAGALAYGLAHSDADFIAIFDADFIPPPDFLRRVIPHLVADAGVGMAQTRWAHLNPDENALTAGQALMLDGHFVVEQTARSVVGWPLNFNGSGGVWRSESIRAAGGWRADTLTEDLDLSYRAQLAGWRFLYLPDIAVPGEIPPYMSAYKQQQRRWAQGSTQCIRLTVPQIWRSAWPVSHKLMATLHLCQYLPHPLMLLLLLVTPPLLLMGGLDVLPSRWFGVFGVIPPLVYAVSQRALYTDWRRRLWRFPFLLALSTGLAWNNARAVWAGVFGGRGEFRRTPKYGDSAAAYALPTDTHAWIELALAAYAAWGAWLAWRINPALIFYMGLYAFAFAFVGLSSLRDQAYPSVRRAAAVK